MTSVGQSHPYYLRLSRVASQDGTSRQDGGPPYTAPVMLKMTELSDKLGC